MGAPDTIVIIHYHLLPGGVRTAISGSLKALAQRGWLSGRSVKVLVGSKGGLEEFGRFLEGIRAASAIVIDPRLDYSERVWPDARTFWQEASALADCLLEQAREVSLYWIHNPTLGKNPLLTAAVKLAATRASASGTPHRFLYHLHDFVECGRLQNLLRLRRCWGSGGLQRFYPLSANCAYAVLSSSDFQRLAQAGVPEERIFLLPNTVSIEPEAGQKSREEIAHSLQEYALANGYHFEAKLKWWTLPLRLIRRKNVIEALLLAATAEPRPQLLVTLDANSESERPYAEAVKELCRKGHCPAVIGFGQQMVGRLFSLAQLLAASEAIVSTSLLEGFGFAFLEGATRGRPLVGRNLEEVTTDFLELGFPASSLYDRFLVPLEPRVRQAFIARGQKFAREKGRLLGVSQERISSFAAAVERIFSEESVDFALLDLPEQLRLAHRLGEGPFVRTLKRLNPQAAEPAVFPQDFPERLERHFGIQAHAARLTTAFAKLFSHSSGVMAREDTSTSLLEIFFSPRYHLPLMGEW